MEIVFATFSVLFGLILGSFFNVLIWRLPRRESIVFPGSHCPACGRAIRPWENIPILSYSMLGGKCAGCKQRISPVYPLVEGLTGAGALIVWLWAFASMRSPGLSHGVHLGLQSFTLLLMIPITVIDLRHLIIPDKLTLPLLVVSFLASFLPGDTTPLHSLGGVLAGGGTLYAIGWLGKIAFRKGDAMGGGDIKLLAAVGALWGPKIALLTIFFGSLSGSLGAVAALFTGKLKQDHRIPFGPYLAFGLWVAVLAGDRILNAYMAFVGHMVAR